MAKIKYSALVSDMRKKLNGSVMSKNRYGSYVRNKVTPVNPQTSYQLQQRARLGQLSQAWGGLTEIQRLAWQDAANNSPSTDIFGDSKTLTGQAFFVSRNLNRLTAGLTVLESPGTKGEFPIVFAEGLDITVTSGLMSAVQVNLNVEVIPAGFSAVVYATPGYDAGKSFVKNQFRSLGVFAAAESHIDVFSRYTERFGSVSVGQKLSFRVALIENATGSLGLPSEVSILLTA